MAENFPFFMTATHIPYSTQDLRRLNSSSSCLDLVSFPDHILDPYIFLSHVSRRKEARLDACKIKIETAPVGWYKNTLEYKSAYFEWPRGALANS